MAFLHTSIVLISLDPRWKLIQANICGDTANEKLISPRACPGIHAEFILIYCPENMLLKYLLRCKRELKLTEFGVNAYPLAKFLLWPSDVTIFIYLFCWWTVRQPRCCSGFFCGLLRYFLPVFPILNVLKGGMINRMSLWLERLVIFAIRRIIKDK